MKKMTKIAIVAASVAAVAAAVLAVILTLPKRPAQVSGSEPWPDRLSSTPLTESTVAPKTDNAQESTTSRTEPAPAQKSQPTAPANNASTTSATTKPDEGQNPLPYRVTAQFPAPDTDDVFVFPEFASNTYYDATAGIRLPYRLYVPADYDKSKRYPVFLFLHGAGDRGFDNTTHIRALENAYRVAGDMLSEAIVLAPQCPSDGWWDIDGYSGSETGCLGAAVRLLRITMAQYRCDRERVYVAGLSMGGYGTWSVLERYGDLFAAGVPICGWGNSAMGEELSRIPIWAYHGTADATVPYRCSLEMVNAIKNAGGRMVRLTSLEGVDHNAWDTALGTRETFSWMFGQTKSKGLAGNDSYPNPSLLRLLSPKGEAVLTDADIESIGGRYIGGSSHLTANLSSQAAKRLRKAYAAYAGQEFTVEYLGQTYYRFCPVGTPQEDEFVFALFAKESIHRLLPLLKK